MTDNIVSLDDYRHKDDMQVLYLVEKTETEDKYISIPLEAIRNLGKEGIDHWLLDEKNAILWEIMMNDYVRFLEELAKDD